MLEEDSNNPTVVLLISLETKLISCEHKSFFLFYHLFTLWSRLKSMDARGKKHICVSHRVVSD